MARKLQAPHAAGPQRSLRHALSRVGTIVATVGLTIWYLAYRTWEYPLLVAAIAASTLFLIDSRDLYARLSRVEILVVGVVLGVSGAFLIQLAIHIAKDLLHQRAGVFA